MPWPYIRSKLARQWHVVPAVVDSMPLDEIVTELHIWSIEAWAESKKKSRKTK